MKRILSLLVLVVLLATTLLGCGGKQATQPADTKATENTDVQTTQSEDTAEANDIDYSGTISMICGAEATAAFEAVMAEYQKLHPDVNIELIIWETITDFETMMTNYIATNTLPDMYCSQVGVVEQQYAAEGYLLPLDDLNIEDNLVNGDKSLIKYKGSLYAFPMTIGYSVTFCNNDKLKELGIDITYENYPKCMDEFIELLQRCREAGCQYPFSVAGSDSSSATAWPFQYIYQVLYGKNPNFYADVLAGKASWSDPEFVKMFEEYSRLREYMAPDTTAKTNDGQKADFISGEAIFYSQTAGTLSTIRSLDPDMDILMIPSSFTEKPEDQTLIGGFDSGISITTGAKNPELCKDFLKFIASKEGCEIFCNNSASIPTVKGAVANTDPAFRLILEIANKGDLPNSAILSRQWISGFKELLKTGCQNWLMGEDAQQVADKIQKEHTRLMEGSPEWVKEFLENYEYQ